MVAAPEEGPEALLAHMVFDRAEVARRPRPARHVEAETGESAPGEPADFAASENADARRRRLPLLQFAPLAAGLLFGISLPALQMQDGMDDPLPEHRRHPRVDDTGDRHVPGQFRIGADQI